MSMSGSVDAQVFEARRALLATPEGRRAFAVHLARLEINGFAGAEAFIDGVLPFLAGQWTDPAERNARFEAVKTAVLSGDPAAIDQTVHDLAEALPGLRDATESSSLRRLPQPIEATPGGTR